MKLYEYILRAKDEFGSTFQKLTTAAGLADSKVDGVRKKMDGVTHSSGRMSNALGNVRNMLVGAFAVGSIVAFASSIAKTGSRMEQTNIAFETFIGNTAIAKVRINELQKFADFSPFNTSDVFAAGESLLGFGVKHQKLLPIMNMLGDASKGNAVKFQSLVDNYGKMNAAQRANTIDLNQFATAGIPIWAELSKQTGLSGNALRKYVEQNGVSLDTIDKMLKNMTGSGGMFFKMMEKQSKSTAGLWSTFVSKIESGYVKIFNLFKSDANSGIAMLSVGLEKVNVFLDFIGKNGSALKKVFAPLKELFNPILRAFDSVQVKSISLEGIFNRIGSVLLFLKPMFSAIGQLVGTVFTKVVEVGTALYGFLGNSKIFSGFVNAFMTSFKNIAIAAKNILGGIGDLVSGILSGDLSKIGAGFKSIGKGLWEGNPLAAGKKAALAFKDGYQDGLKLKNFFGPTGSVAPGMPGGDTRAADGSVGPSPGSDVKAGIDSISGGGSKATNIHVEFRNFVENMNNEFGSVSEGMADLEQKFREMFARVMNGGLYAANQ